MVPDLAGPAWSPPLLVSSPDHGRPPFCASQPPVSPPLLVLVVVLLLLLSPLSSPPSPSLSHRTRLRSIPFVPFHSCSLPPRVFRAYRHARLVRQGDRIAAISPRPGLTLLTLHTHTITSTSPPQLGDLHSSPPLCCLLPAATAPRSNNKNRDANHCHQLLCS